MCAPPSFIAPSASALLFLVLMLLILLLAALLILLVPLLLVLLAGLLVLLLTALLLLRRLAGTAVLLVSHDCTLLEKPRGMRCVAAQVQGPANPVNHRRKNSEALR